MAPPGKTMYKTEKRDIQTLKKRLTGLRRYRIPENSTRLSERPGRPGTLRNDRGLSVPLDFGSDTINDFEIALLNRSFLLNRERCAFFPGFHDLGH